MTFMTKSDPGQAARFVATARATEADESGADFERLFVRIVRRQTTNTTPIATEPAAPPADATGRAP
jgi:hypothetical protein